ncbi:hypothetical protein MMPV_004141 [Pyropia vietnamensis]
MDSVAAVTPAVDRVAVVGNGPGTGPGAGTGTRGRPSPNAAHDASNIWHVFSLVLPATTVWRAKEARLHSVWHPIGGYKWRIFLYPRGNQQNSDLSVYIECGGPIAAADAGDGAQSRPRRVNAWSRPTAFKIVLLLPPGAAGDADAGRPAEYIKDATHVFTPKESDWGFKDFYALSALRPARGVPLADAPPLRIEAHVQLVTSIGSITVLPDWDSRAETGYVGLRNQGATCYLNSLLQMLYCLPGFRRMVYALPIPPPEGAAGAEKVPAAIYQCHELQKVFHGLQTAQGAVRTKRLTESFGWNSAELFQQHDAQELNRILCDRLSFAATSRILRTAAVASPDGGVEVPVATPPDGDGTMVRADADESSQAKDFVATLFQGRTANVIRCLDVPYVSEMRECFFDISLTVSGLKGVLEAFAAYTQVEMMDGDNCVRADGYEELQRAEKGAQFISLPPVLQLHLKRFDYDFSREPPVQVKINDYFEYGDEIDLSSFVKGADGTPGDGDDVFVLHTVLVHIGDVDTGHYCAFIRPNGPGGAWLKFDDETVTCVSAADALDANYGFGGPHQPPLPPPVELTESLTGLSPSPLPPVPSPLSRQSSSPLRAVRSPSPEADVTPILNDTADVLDAPMGEGLFGPDGSYTREDQYNVITAATDGTGLSTNTPDPPVAEITTGETTSPSPSSLPSAPSPLTSVAPVVRTIRARPPNCRFSSAYMLQYVRKSRVADLLKPEEELPASLTARILEDQAAEAARRARAAEAHLYRHVYVMTDAHLKDHVTGDLVCWARVPSVRVRRDCTLVDLKRALIRAGAVSRWQPSHVAKSTPAEDNSSPATLKDGDLSEDPTATATTVLAEADAPDAKRRKDALVSLPPTVRSDAEQGVADIPAATVVGSPGADLNTSASSHEEDSAEALGWLRLWKCSPRDNKTIRPDGLVANGEDNGLLEPSAPAPRVTRNSAPRPVADDLRIYAQVLTGPDLIADRDGLYSTHTLESSFLTPPSRSPSSGEHGLEVAPTVDTVVRAAGEKLPLGKRKRGRRVPDSWPMVPAETVLFFVKQYLPLERRLVYRGTFLAWKDGFVRGLIPAAARVCGLTIPAGQTADTVVNVYEEVKLDSVEMVTPSLTMHRAELDLGGDILVVELKAEAQMASLELATPRADRVAAMSASECAAIPLGGRPLPCALSYYAYLRHAVVVEFRERWSSDFVGSQGSFSLELLATDSMETVVEEVAATLRLSVPSSRLRFFLHDEFSEFARPERLFSSSHPTLAHMLSHMHQVTGSWLAPAATTVGGPELNGGAAPGATTHDLPAARGPSLSVIGRQVGMATLLPPNAVLCEGVLWYEVAEYCHRDFADHSEVRVVYRPDGGAVGGSAATSTDKVIVESGVAITPPISFSVLVPRLWTYGRLLASVRERLSLPRSTNLRLLDIRGHVVHSWIQPDELVESNTHMVEPGTELRVEPDNSSSRAATVAASAVVDPPPLGDDSPAAAQCLLPLLHVTARRNATTMARTDAPVFFGTPVMVSVPRDGMLVSDLRAAVASRLGVKPDVFASWRLGQCVDSQVTWFEDPNEHWVADVNVHGPDLLSLAVEHVRTGGGSAAGGRGHGATGGRKAALGLSRLPDKPLLIRS